MQPTIYSSNLPLEKTHIDREALHVIHRLKEAGYKAYLVGGGVRDLLLGKIPKDYDISTSAKPEEVKRLFGRQCILIGRRFRLAHIRYGNKILEVSTFRSGETSEDLITHDNVWGSEQEDVLRRDFTINGLFYDPETHTVIDYVGGWKDLHEGILHTIGNPEIRFKQDPVRMIRLIKFQARFGFKTSNEIKKALQNCLSEINKSSPARILEEMLRMLESCASKPFFELLLESGLMLKLFPNLAHAFKGTQGGKMFQYLEAMDTINKTASKFPIERPVLTAAILYPLLEQFIKTHYLEKGGIPHAGDMIGHSSELVRDIIISSFSHFPRKISSVMIYVLSTQYRLTPLKQKKQHPSRLFKIREFPMALRLLKIRAMIDPSLQTIYIRWREMFRHYLRTEDHAHYHRLSHERKSYESTEAKRGNKSH